MTISKMYGTAVFLDNIFDTIMLFFLDFCFFCAKFSLEEDL